MSVAARLAKGSAYSLARVAVALVTAFAFSVLINRMLGPEAAGHFYLVEAFLLMATTAANLGLVDTALRYVSEGRDQPATAAGVVTLLALAELVWGGLVALALSGFAPWFASGMHEPHLSLWLGLAALGVLPLAFSLLMFAVVQAHERYDQLAKAYLLVLPTKVVAAFLALWWGWGVTGLIVVTVASHLGMAIALACFSPVPLRLSAIRSLPPGWLSRMIRYAPAMGLLVILTAVVWDRSEIFFLGAFHPAREVAFYGTAFTLAALVMRGIPGILGQLLTPISVSFRGDRAQLGHLWQQATRHLLAIALPIAALGWCLAPSIMLTLYGPDFVQAAPALGPLLVGLGAGAVGAAEAAVKFSLERVDLLVKVAVAAGALNLLLDWWWIPSGGATGAAYACAVTQLVVVSVGTLLTAHLLNASFPWSSLGQVLVSSLIAAALCAGTHATFGLIPALAAGIVAYPIALTISGFWTPADRRRLEALWAWVRGCST